jgi:hypothetical protein
MNVEIEKLLGIIIKKEMSLSDSQVWIYNSDFKIPNTDGLYIVIEFLNSKTKASNSEIVNSTGEMVEYQETVTREDIQIDVCSKNKESRQRKNEVTLALSGMYSQQLQEEQKFRIFSIPSNFTNTSKAEGSAMITRFSITVKCLCWYRKEVIHKDYYDSFGIDVYDEPVLEANTPLFHIDYDE